MRSLDAFQVLPLFPCQANTYKFSVIRQNSDLPRRTWRGGTPLFFTKFTFSFIHSIYLFLHSDTLVAFTFGELLSTHSMYRETYQKLEKGKK